MRLDIHTSALMLARLPLLTVFSPRKTDHCWRCVYLFDVVTIHGYGKQFAWQARNLWLPLSVWWAKISLFHCL